MRDKQRQFNTWENGPDFDRARTQISTPFQHIDIALDVATANRIVNISGDFLYLDASSTGQVTLELNNQYNDASAPFYASPGFGLNALFKQIKLSWVAQPGKKVRIMYSTGDRVVPTNSTTVNGYVNTVDGGLSRTLAGIVFLGNSNLAAVAGQYSHVQLWNPATSQVSLYVEALSLSSAVAGAIGVGKNVTALPTAGQISMNKYLGGAVAAGLLKITNNAVQQYVPGFGLSYTLAAGIAQVINFREPIVVPPGNGLVCFAGAVNTDLTACFEWYEQ